MSGWGKYTVKYKNRSYDSFDPEEMSFDFSGCSDIGTFEIKGKSTSSWDYGKEYEEKYMFSIERLEQMKKILDKFFEEY
jgi:hypothetical protein